MSSFSSVIRKPGAKVAPKVAPRRNIVRKVPQAQSLPQSQSEARPAEPQIEVAPIVEAEAVSLPARAETLQTPSQIAQLEPEVPFAGSDEQQLQHEKEDTSRTAHIKAREGDSLQPDLLSEHSEENTTPVVAAVLQNTSPPPAPTPHIENWPADKARPERNVISKIFRSQAKPDLPTPPEQDTIHDPIENSAEGTNAVVNGNDSTTRGETVPVPAPLPTLRAHRKRKQPPRASASIILAHAQASVPTPPATQPSPDPVRGRAHSVSLRRAPSIASQRSETEEHLDRINAQLQRVGEIAAEITRRTPAAESSSAAATGDEVAVEDTAQHLPRKRRKRSNGKSQTIQEQAADIVAAALGDPGLASSSSRGRGRQRRPTPDHAEAHQIDPETTNMSELLDDKKKWGKVSEIEKQMQANWPEILKRRREDAAARYASAQEDRRHGKKSQKSQQTVASSEAVGDAAVIPELVIENGNLVISSRTVDRSEQTRENMEKTTEVRDDELIYKRVNAHTVGNTRFAPGQQWDDSSTEMFYQGLKMFGTDFKMISNMIPGKNRRSVKLKYNHEERNNWPRVQRTLSQKEDVCLDSYAQMTGMEMTNVADLYKQMEEDEKRLREEDEQRRREEGIISQDQNEANAEGEADVAIPSIEGQEGDASTADGTAATAGDRQSTAAASRLGSTTTGRQTAQPAGPNAKKKKASKQPNPNSKRGRAAAKNRGAEGIEERLGDVGDVSIPMG